MNPITLIDGYKLDHRRQYPDDTTSVYSNWTPRGSRVKGQDEVVFFGLQYFLQRYLMDEMQAGFWFPPKRKVLEKYAARVNAYIGPNAIGTDHIAALYDLKYMPLIFRALPEGTLTPTRVPMFTVENTIPEFYWVVNYIESLMSSVLWMPCTSATTAYRFRKLFNQYAQGTGADPAGVAWQGHDFSFRGMAGPEAAAMSGAGHLLSFTGTDSIPALDFIDQYYPGSPEGEVIGGSVPATEHSVMCAGGKGGEIKTFERLLDLYPAGILSVVSDTWDLWEVLTDYLPRLKEQILGREGKLVIRPDSGDPVDILCGNPAAEVDTPESMGVLALLWAVFGGTINAHGYKELDPHIGAIYGDAISYERADEICSTLRMMGYASSNVVFGLGSYTYQHVTRDTYEFAMKATAATVDGEARELFKDPITGSGMKKSAMGRLAVHRIDGELELIEQATRVQETVTSRLKPVWSNGKFLSDRQSFANVRQTLWRGETS